MALQEAYAEVDQYMRELSERAKVVKSHGSDRSQDSLKTNLEEASVLAADIAVCVFQLRFLSWELLREYQRLGEPSVLQFSYQRLRDEIRDNIYAMTQMASGIQERSRSIRAMMMTS